MIADDVGGELTASSFEGFPSSPSLRKKRSVEMLRQHKAINRICRPELDLAAANYTKGHDIRMPLTRASRQEPNSA